MRPLTYIRTFLHSLSTPKYYLDVLNVKLGFTLRFVLVSYFLFALISGAVFAFIEVPNYAKVLHTYIDQHAPDFPQDTEITWNGKTLSSTTNKTLSLPFPAIATGNQLPSLLLQFNPEVKSPADIAAHSEKSSFLYIGESEVFVAQPDGTWSSSPLADLLVNQENFTITAETVREHTPQLHQIVQRSLRILSIAFPFFFFFATLTFRFFNVLLDSILIYLVVKMVNLPIGFKKVLQISLHIMVIAELVSLISLIFKTDLQMFTITFWCYTAFIYWQLRNVQMLPSSIVVDQDIDQS